jgi:hypothetical protein
LSRIGAGTNFENPTSALFGDHATLKLTEGLHRFRRDKDPRWTARTQLYGTLGARYFYVHTGLDLNVSGQLVSSPISV